PPTSRRASAAPSSRAASTSNASTRSPPRAAASRAARWCASTCRRAPNFPPTPRSRRRAATPRSTMQPSPRYTAASSRTIASTDCLRSASPSNCRTDVFHIVLFEPEIPPNTGNLIRLAANTGCELHLVKPLGFRLDRKSVRRAGLEYDELATVHVHENFAAARAALTGRWFAIETGGTRRHVDAQFSAGD